jgi:peptidyl-tRNA hydrolase, PTH1 family
MENLEKFDHKKIKAIIGLGNPDQKYYKNRHNIGFRVVDAIAEKFSVSFKVADNLEYAQVSWDENSKPVYLIKPLTFMNKSGQVISFLAKKGIKIEEILVAHDELEKDFGKLGIKFGGSARGHNGLRSIMEVAGQSFWRLRFGIGRPADKSEVSDYVLSNFSKEEESKIDQLVQESVDLILNN